MNNIENICIEEIFGDSLLDNIIIMYPDRLHNEKILQDNIVKMKALIKDYINVYELYQNYKTILHTLIWDSQKNDMQNKIDESQQNMDKIAEQMNDGISPYAWYMQTNFKVDNDEICLKAKYCFYLDRV